jgi:asparagine synthase (glutamine-hydrolysing)
MCGICGSLGPADWQPREEAQSIVKVMCAAIAHRGNDGHGIYQDPSKGITLGHQRLSIIDVEGGAQPLNDSNNKAWIVFNGEIYNFKALRAELRQLGFQFKTRSDTEVVVQAYLAWGESCVEKLQGMFAFAIWDSRDNSLFCARDRLGMKPFYYYWDGKHFVFASEIKSLLKHPVVKREQDTSAFRSYLQFRYIPAPDTIYKNIKKLPAASLLKIKAGEFKTQKYWDIGSFSENKSVIEAEYIEKLHDHLESAVTSHMNSDVPLGAFLSGGIDSSAIVGLMSHSRSQPTQTFTARFNNAVFDESHYAAAISKHFHTNHHELTINMNVKEDLEKIIYHLDEPFADASAIPTYYICREARKSVTVCLSGDGGDELFAGYNWYSELIRLQKINRAVPDSLAKALSSLLSRVLPKTYPGASLFENIGLMPKKQHINLMSCFSSDDIDRLCHLTDNANKTPNSAFETAFDSFNGRQNDVVKMAQTADIQTYLVEDILMKVDKMSMAHGLEVRVPMLDHKLVELAMSMPTAMKIQGNDRKKVLKNSVQNLIPNETLNRPKQGFSAPIEQWLNEDLRDMFGDLLLAPNANDSGMFDRKEVGKLWHQYSNNKLHVGLSERLWTLLCYEAWHSVY